MKVFKKDELASVIIILFIVIIFTAINLKGSLRRARDVQRQADISEIAEALNRYYVDFGFYPPNTLDGRIKACKGKDFDSKIIEFKNQKIFDFYLYTSLLDGCGWGKDALVDLNDPSYKPYLDKLQNDPKNYEGATYYYLSNTKRFQLYSYLEGGISEDVYNKGIVSRNLPCGKYICSYGKSSGSTPIDMSIEEYEAKLLIK